MLVLERPKALVLNLSNPDRVRSVLPEAKTINIKDKSVVVVPHTLNRVKTLRSLGIEAPSPILHYYDWPGRFKPFAHQRKTAEFLTLNNKCIVLNDLGTGKTASALWAADYLIQTKHVKKVLIVSPLSTLERVWADAIFSNLIGRKFVVLHGSAERRSKLLRQDVDFYIINHDGFRILAPEMHGKFDLVIIDEAAVLRNGTSQRFKSYQRWFSRNNKVRLWLMTGTPTPNEPTDAWALAKLIDSPYCPQFFTHFRDQVMVKTGMHMWEPRDNAMDTVSKVLTPSIRYTRDDCFDLPATLVQSRQVPMTAEQKQHYNAMRKDLITEMQSGQLITAVNQAVKLQKLVQIACGVAYGENGQEIELDCSPRINEVRDVIEQSTNKVIIFVPLTGTLNMLERELSKDYTVAVVNGSVPASKRNQIFHDFQHSLAPRILIAHPATMAHGLTLTEASTIIWYGPITSNEQYTQANGRIERPGKRVVSTLVHIHSTDTERKMYARLEKKQSLQGVLLELLNTGDVE